MQKLLNDVLSALYNMSLENNKLGTEGKECFAV